MKKNKRNIFVVGSSRDYANWMQGHIVNRIQDADLVLFTGGEDVDPSLYYEQAHPRTCSNRRRDDHESQVFNAALSLKKHMIGICRGSQFLCVRSGGRLVQDQPNPNFVHIIRTYDGKELIITSTHHQAQYPWELSKNEFKLLGWTEKMLSNHQNGRREEMEMPEGKESEIVYYPSTKCLAIQGHPEMLVWYKTKESAKTIKYLQNLLDKHMEDAIM